MNTRYLLGIALAVAGTVAAACSSPADPGNLHPGGTDPGTDPGTTTDPGKTPGKTGGTTTPTPTGPDTNTPTNSPTGKAFYTANVHPFLASGCGGCHDAAGPGPNWIFAAQPDNTYTHLFQVGYVTADSRIIAKGAHGGSTTNVLSDTQKATYLKWVNQELADGGNKATPNVLEKLGSCIDQTKLQAIGLQNLQTQQRTNENANRCTGCNQASCRNCHSGDDATGFVMAIGNQVLPADYTYQQTKLTNPAYLQKYFGISPTGDPIASDALKTKALATQKDKPYTHPMFTIPATTQTNLDAFVQDAITKYKAGTCGK